MPEAKVPVPLVAQVAEVAEPPNTPNVVKVPSAQIVASTPALTVATGLMVKTIASFTAGHGPAGSLVV